MPWDHLPGALIHAEAGGYSARFDGSEYNCSTLEDGIIAAPDEESWQRVRSAPRRGVGHAPAPGKLLLVVAMEPIP